MALKNHYIDALKITFAKNRPLCLGGRQLIGADMCLKLENWFR